MTVVCKKGAQNFHRALSRVFDGVESVALWFVGVGGIAQGTIRAAVQQLIFFRTSIFF